MQAVTFFFLLCPILSSSLVTSYYKLCYLHTYVLTSPITYLLTFIPHTSLPLSPFISESSILVCKSLYCFSFMPRVPVLFLSCPLECTPVLYSSRYFFTSSFRKEFLCH